MAVLHLYLTNDKLIAILKRGDTTVAHEKFNAKEIGEGAFPTFLGRHQNTPTRIYVDLIEEDFRLDTVPHLRGSDSAAVIERRLGQLYRSSPYKHAIIQGRETEGRKDDQVFFHALTNQELLKSVLDVIETRKVPLDGVYSSPVLSHQLLKDLDLQFPHTLLVSIVPDFGLRQTYFQGKTIKFSRITPISYDEGQSVGTLIAAETSRTWQYLDSLRFFTADDSLEVCILLHERDRAMVAEAIRTFPLLRYRFLEIGEVAAKLKLKPIPTTSHAEEVMVHLFSKSRPENHFASKESTRFGFYRRARIALFTVTAVILFAGIAATGFNFFQATQISARIEARSRDESRLNAEYQEVFRSIRDQRVATEAVRDSSIFYNSQLRPGPPSPGEFLREVSQVMGDFPNVTIDRLTWAVSNDPNLQILAGIPPRSGAGPVASTPGSIDTPVAANKEPAKSNEPTATGVVAALRSGAAVPITEVPRTNIAAAAPVNEPDPPLAGNKFHHLVIDASFNLYDGNLRQAIQDVDRLRARLAMLPHVTASIIQLPVDTSNDARLKVDNTGMRKPTFVVKLSRKVQGT